MQILKASSKSSPSALAGAISGCIRESGACEIQVIGAGALNQAVKAVAISRGYLAPQGHDIIAIPAFGDLLIDGEERTCLRLIIEPR